MALHLKLRWWPAHVKLIGREGREAITDTSHLPWSSAAGNLFWRHGEIRGKSNMCCDVRRDQGFDVLGSKRASARPRNGNKRYDQFAELLLTFLLPPRLSGVVQAAELQTGIFACSLQR